MDRIECHTSRDHPASDRSWTEVIIVIGEHLEEEEIRKYLEPDKSNSCEDEGRYYIFGYKGQIYTDGGREKMAVDTRILFTDLDGTLLNDKKEITPGNRAAVDEALAKGHKIVVTTGRALASGLQIAERVGLTGEGCYVIAFNGGQIYDPYHRETIHGVTFSQDTAAEIFEKAVERNLYMQAYSDEAILTVENNELLQQYAKYRTYHIKS